MVYIYAGHLCFQNNAFTEKTNKSGIFHAITEKANKPVYLQCEGFCIPLPFCLKQMIDGTSHYSH